ncbi:MAG TPA: DUF5615 family PIN-like protein [Sporichthyaceae bacterium]|nr:DUF5615 family PIN-like protein [Sporichthyaceae bacterium]
MRFLLDANLSPRLGPILAADGHEVVHVLDLGLVNASDEAILSQALIDGSVVITADSDFAMLLALRDADRPSVIQLRHVNELSTEEIGVLLDANLPTGYRRPDPGRNHLAEPDTDGRPRATDPLTLAHGPAAHDGRPGRRTPLFTAIDSGTPFLLARGRHDTP